MADTDETMSVEQREVRQIADEYAKHVPGFEAAFPYLSHDKVEKTELQWGRIAYQHSHVDALFEGWVKGRQSEASLLKEAVDLLWQVEGAMLRGGDGQIEDFGWSITKLGKARPVIRAFLSRIQSEDDPDLARLLAAAEAGDTGVDLAKLSDDEIRIALSRQPTEGSENDGE